MTDEPLLERLQANAAMLTRFYSLRSSLKARYTMGYGVTYGIGSERNWATSTRKKHVKKHVEEGRKPGAFAEEATERLELETAWMNILFFSILGNA